MESNYTVGLERLYEDQVVLNISETVLLELVEAKEQLIGIFIDTVSTTPCVVSPPENEGYYKRSLIEDGIFPLAFKAGYDGCPYPRLQYDEAIKYGMLRVGYASAILLSMEKGVTGSDLEGYLSGYHCLMGIIYERAFKRSEGRESIDLLSKESLVDGFMITFDGRYSEAFWKGLTDAVEEFVPDTSNSFEIVTGMFETLTDSTSQQPPPTPPQT